MVIAIVTKIAQIAFRHRKTIYKVLTAQDRAIGSSFRKGGYSKATQYGARHGALAGTVIGSVLSNIAPDSPGNEFQKPFEKRQRVTPSKPYQARRGFPIRGYSRYRRQSKFDYCKRQPSYRQR